MEKKYEYSLTSFVCIGIFILGVILGLINFIDYNKFHNAKPLKYENLETAAQNEYVKVSISEYFVKMVGNTPVGVSEEFLIDVNRVQAYTVPVGDGQYVIMLISNLEHQKQLEQFEMGKGDPVTFVGKVAGGSIVNFGWYRDVKDFSTDNINQRVYIREVSDFKSKNLAMLGGFIAFFAGAGFLMSRTPYSPAEEDPRYVRKPRRSYYPEHELEAEKIRYENLEKRSRDLKRDGCIGLVLTVVGLGFNQSLLISFLLIATGIGEVYSWFKNSDWSVSVKFAELCGFKTNHTMKVDTLAKIARLEKEIEEKKAKEEQ